MLGILHDSSTFANYHTQLCRASAFGGGASGGMDDQFDFILIPYLLSTIRKLVYKSGSFKAHGNDGLHLNNSVNYGTNGAVTADIPNSLYRASDHLPVVIELIPPTSLIYEEWLESLREMEN